MLEAQHPDVTTYLGESPKKLIIGGAQVPALSGKTFTAYNPSDGAALVDVCRGRAGRCGPRGGSCADRAEKWLGQTGAGSAGGDPTPVRRPHPGAPRGTGATRIAGQRQAAGAHPAHRRPRRWGPDLPQRRPAHQDRRGDPDGVHPRPIRVHPPGAGGCGRHYHPVELPADPRGAEDRPGARLRQRRDPEAGHGGFAGRAAPGRAGTGSRPPAWAP